MSDNFISQPHPTRKNFKNLTNQKFGRLTVVSYAGYKDPHALWNCLCDCGNQKISASYRMRNGQSLSCGCIHMERNTKHGKTISAEYNSWSDMKKRCFNKKSNGYKWYGARGITVCNRWKDSFENFLADMGPKPTPKHTIDRTDNDGNYEPSNCKWSTPTEQARNRRVFKNNKSGHTGVFLRDTGEYNVYINVNKKSVSLGTYRNLKDAVNARKEGERIYWR